MRTARVTLGMALWLSLSGCASTPGQDRGGLSRNASHPGAPEPSSASLSELALRERTAPRWIDPSDPVWAPLGITPPDPSRGQAPAAHEPLEAIIGRLASEPIESDRLEPAPTPGADEREAGAYLLDSALAQLEQGDAARAIELLDRAASTDPSSSTIEDARVRALLRLSRRSDAVDAASVACSLGSDDALSHLTLGLEAKRAGEDEAAARHLARALRPGSDQLDAASLAVARAALGELLLDRGMASGAGELVRLAISNPPTPGDDTLFRSELVRLLGQRRALWERIGEALAPLDPDAAIEAYAQGAALAGDDDRANAQRLGLLLRTGRPSEGAAEILRSLQAVPRPLNEGERALIRALGRDREVAPALSAALLESARSIERLGATARGALVLEAARLAPPQRGAPILRAALDEHGYQHTLARELLGDPDRPIGERAGDARRLVHASPGDARRYAAALLSAPSPTPARIREAVRRLPPGWDTALLAAGLDLQLRRPRDAFAMVESMPDAPGGAQHLARIECASAIGRWDVVARSVEALRREQTEPGPQRVRALRAAHRFDEALVSAERLGTQDQLDVELQLELAELAIQLERPRDAELSLELASELDPYDERVLVSQLALYAENAPLADPAQHTRVLRNLRQRAPEGVYVALLNAQELIASGVLDEPETRLRELVERNPDQRGAYELLHQIWTRRAGAPGADDDDAEAWLRARVEASPGQPVPSAALARLLGDHGRLDEALGVIDACEASAGSALLAGLRERLLREGQRASEANEHALARLSHPTLSIDEALERAEIELASTTHAEALGTLEPGLPEGVALTPAQRARLLRLATVALASIGSTGFDDPALAAESGPVLGIIELALDRAGALPWTLHNARITLTAIQPQSSVEHILRVCEDSAEASPARTLEAYRAGARPLLASQRVPEALAVTLEGAVRDGELHDELFTDAISIAAQGGDVDDTRALIERLDSAGLIGEGARRLRPEPDTPLDSPEAQRAELAYQIASIATFFERDDLAERVYRLALEYDPDHAWSNNDLGYMLVDRGSDVAGGERLIARAYARLPESHNVTDSLAWARYKLGQLGDEPGREGAVTLLRRAIELQDSAGQVNATLHDHLGDALWRAGQTDEAIESWLSAETIALEQTRTLRRDGARAALRRVEDRLQSVRKKLRATQTGEAPPVAPLAGEGDGDESGG